MLDELLGEALVVDEPHRLEPAQLILDIEPVEPCRHEPLEELMTRARTDGE